MNDVIDYAKLREPMDIKYKPQAIKYGKATIVAYVDARDVQDRLDSTVEPSNWATQFSLIDGTLYCGLGINTTKNANAPNWVWKWDCGTESNMEKEKGQTSDAFFPISN